MVDVLSVVLSIFLPPLAVFLKRGLGTDFWVNLILTLLVFVPGILHALIVTGAIPETLCGVPAKRVLELVLCIICPPVPVFLTAGLGVQLLINIILCFLFYIPAIIHALVVCSFIALKGIRVGGGGRGNGHGPPAHARAHGHHKVVHDILLRMIALWLYSREAHKMADILSIILSIFLPPLAVFLKKGVGRDFWLSIVLTIFMFIPGILHAFIVTESGPERICGVPTKRVLELVLCILAPPVAVFMTVGWGTHFIINIILCFVIYFPAIIHALLVCAFFKLPGPYGAAVTASVTAAKARNAVGV